MIKSRTSGLYYIGQAQNLRTRWQEWKGVITTGLGFKSLKMKDAFTGTQPENWDFIIIERRPTDTREELLAREKHEINRWHQIDPGNLLNTIIPGKGAGTARSRMVYEGRPISGPGAAYIIGCNIKTLQKRLKRLRTKGIFEVSVECLRDDSKRYKGVNQT